MASALSTTAQRSPSPITAPWVIAEAARLGGDFLHWLLCSAGPTRRQVTFALGAKGWLASPEGIVAQLAPHRLIDPIPALAELCLSASPTDLISAAFGSTPQGFVEALKRLGTDALSEPSKYEDLFALYADRSYRPRMRVAQHLGKLTEERLDMLMLADPALLSVGAIDRFTSVDEVAKLNTILGVVREMSDPSSDDALAQAAAGGAARTRLLLTWISHCRLASVGIEADQSVAHRQLIKASDLIAQSRAFKNCAGSLHRVVHAICGRTAYFVHDRDGRASAMSRLLRFEDGWRLEYVYGPGNESLDASIYESIFEWFAVRGIPSLRRPKLAPEWETLLNMAGHRRWATPGTDINLVNG